MAKWHEEHPDYAAMGVFAGHGEGILFEPAECWSGCDDPQCPYTHRDSWRIGEQVFFSEGEAMETLIKGGK